jgi:hypothetical protein
VIRITITIILLTLAAGAHTGCRPADETPADPNLQPTAAPTVVAEPEGAAAPEPAGKAPGEAAADVIRTRIAWKEREKAPPSPTPRVRIDAELTEDGLIAAPSIHLMWTPDAAGAFSYEDAVGYCRALELGGRDGWRLPTASELVELLAADIVPASPGRGGSLWTSSPAEHRGVITIDTTDWRQSWSETGLGHVICVRELTD